MDEHYIMGVPIPKSSENYDPFLQNPGSGWLPASTKRLDLFVNLNDIPDQDIFKTFSLWNVRLKK